MVRRDGLGDYLFKAACAFCKALYGGSKQIFRCKQCGEFLQCEDCLRSRHALNPLHSVKAKSWMEAIMTGTEPNDAGLTGVGLVYQLGHHGFPCDFPHPKRLMVVMDIMGIYTLDVQYCGCDEGWRTSNINQVLRNAWWPATPTDPATCATFQVLEKFRLLNVVSNVNVHDFVGTLERLTDPLRLSSVPDRYKAFGRMSRQWGFVVQGKRLGRAHVTNRLPTTPAGGLGVLCWSCPHDGKNLPDGWRDVDPKYRFLYMLLLALDANFRLKNRLRANEHQDPSLGSGMGYFVESEAYKKHLKDYVAEKDVSSCIAFAALLQKETRLTTGLRVSGVGGCICAQHGVVRPLGLGDLQKGERYANMDYIFLSAMAGVAVVLLAVSYDIACQWKVNLKTRATKIKDTTPIITSLDDFEIQFALPVWHAVAHEVTCQTQNSLSYAQGVGRTDGEGIEWTWAVLNPVGFATKEMGDGARHDAIEDKIDHLNFEKNIGQGDLLARKLIVAIAERDKQVEEFKEVDGSLTKKLHWSWQERIDKWLANSAELNPYCLEGGKSGTESAVLQELKAEEVKEAAEGRAPLSDSKMTLSSFLKAGLQLEEAQHRIKAEVKGVTLVTADRSSQIQELRISLLKKIWTYEKMQDIYMPGVAALREEAEDARDRDAPAPKAEDIKLWMPSELTVAQRRAAARRGAGDAEAQLCHRQCTDALDNLRSRLHAQRHLVMWRNTNSVGQRAATRSATLIGRVGDRIKRLADKYRHARSALIALKGASFAPQFQELKPEHLNVHAEQESDMEARTKLARLNAKKKSRLEPKKNEKISWIWMAGSGPGADEGVVHDCTWNPVRVEWAKAKAQKDRWEEEVAMLCEEMKRTLRMLRWIQMEWQSRAEQRTNVDVALAAGLKAYALQQVDVHRRLAGGFHAIWSKLVATAVRDVMRQDGTVYRELLDGQGVDSAPVVGLEEVEEAVMNEEISVRRSSRRVAGAEQPVASSSHIV
ncbi:hypothetical protein FB451DRAFT_1030190 [Mycena latifolia]|nr:hypothetical protein FB451DRAFT_1030190 [Mycena latifolia]